MILNNVDLPQPDGPMMDTNSPGAMEKEMSSTAVIAPSLVMKRLVTRSTSSRCVGCGCVATPVATDGPAGRSIAALGSALTPGEPAFGRLAPTAAAEFGSVPRVVPWSEAPR